MKTKNSKSSKKFRKIFMNRLVLSNFSFVHGEENNQLYPILAKDSDPEPRIFVKGNPNSKSLLKEENKRLKEKAQAISRLLL